MATCANCIHHSLCDYNTNISGNGKVRLVYAEGADVKCSFFQNTADVVPKSEGEELKGELVIAERHEKDARALFKDAVIQLQNVKTEVAREIFAEIETIAKTVAYPEMLINGIIVSRNLNGMYLDIEDYDELKKKHTEESQ